MESLFIKKMHVNILLRFNERVIKSSIFIIFNLHTGAKKKEKKTNLLIPNTPEKKLCIKKTILIKFS